MTVFHYFCALTDELSDTWTATEPLVKDGRAFRMKVKALTVAAKALWKNTPRWRKVATLYGICRGVGEIAGLVDKYLL